MVGPEPEKWRSRFLYELRLSRPAREGKRKLTQAEFADELDSKGVPLVREPGATAEAKRIAYNRFEKGTGAPPSEELLAQIAKLYGVPPPQPPAETPTADLGSLVAALHGQTLAITRLANALWPKPQTREEREAALVEQIASLTAELALLQEGGDPEPQAQPERRRRTQG